jgi:ribonuclease BN (tRNA processing enzyme)
MSSIKILGAYGAKSAKGGSSAFLLNSRHVLDAGNLLRPLREESAKVETIWITHSHLDHISDIAYILDNYYAQREVTLKLCALPETLSTLQKHFFNNEIWPDFSKIPLANGSAMSLSFEEVLHGTRYAIGKNEYIEPFKTDHTVASCGYVITKKNKSVLVSADTYSLDTVIDVVKKNTSITTLVIECSFPSAMHELAKASKHLTVKLLFERLRELEGRGLMLYVNHLKPSYEDVIKNEIIQYQGIWNTTVLVDGDKINF